MKARLQNYSKSVWKGKDTNNTGYHGLRSMIAKNQDGLSETTTTGKKKKLTKEKEAERIQAVAKIHSDVLDTLDKKEEYERKIKEANDYKLQTEKRYNEEMAKRDAKGAIKDKNFLKKQNTITESIHERPLRNPTLLDKQEELRRNISEFEEDKLKKQREQSNKISELEKNKIGETGFKNAQTEGVSKTYVLSNWERNDLKEQNLKNREPENPTEYYELKFDSQALYNFSSEVKYDTYLEQVKFELGDRDYNRLRELFELYAGVISPLQMGKIESYQFHLFLKDHGLYSEDMDRTSATLKFFKGNTSKSINFESFCRILTDLSIEKYPWEHNKSVAFRQFVKHSVFSKKFYEKEKVFEKVLDELYSPDVQDLLNDKKQMAYLRDLFDVNSKKVHEDGKTIDVVDLIAANKISINISVIPDLISKLNFVKLFKIVQPSEMNLLSKSKNRDYLTFDEFKHLIAATGIFSYRFSDGKFKLISNYLTIIDEILKAKFPKAVQTVVSIMKLYTKQ